MFSLIIPVRDEDHDVIEELWREVQDMIHDGSIQEAFFIDDDSLSPSPLCYQYIIGPRGYGAALKRGVLLSTKPYCITMDGDGQHSLSDVKRLVDFVAYFPEVDMVVGDRRLRETSFFRFLGRKFLNICASCFAGRWIPDLNSGLRVFRTKVALGYEPILADGFSYTTSLTLSMMADGYAVDFLPVRVRSRAYGRSKVRLFRDGLYTLYLIFRNGIALRTRSLRRLIGLRHLRSRIHE